jgi:CRISPR type III-A/MTUBE-associated protein Csm6
LNKILFSPIGDTDPVRFDYDGPMLHIVRYYRPEKVFLYFTKEMQEKDEAYNLYEECIKRVLPECTVEKIYSGVENAHYFDVFIKDFRQRINQICSDYPNSEIYLNVSSGTPQMISSLCLIAASSSFKLIPVQVGTPEKRSNAKKGYEIAKTIDEIFSNLYDEIPEFATNRCIDPGIVSFKIENLKSSALAMIRNYDYRRLYEYVKENKQLFGSRILQISEHLEKRIHLDRKADQSIKEVEGFNFYPVKNPAFNLLLEYYLSMAIKQKRGELSDFVLRTTPFLTRLTTDLVENHLKFKLEEITFYRNGVEFFSRKKLEKFNRCLMEYIEKEIKNSFRDGPVGLTVLIAIAKFLTRKKQYQKTVEIVNKIEFFREKVEIKLRNLIAHEIRELNELDIKKSTGKSSEGLLNDFKFVFKRFYGEQLKEEAFSIYEDINKFLLTELEKL